MRSNSRDATVRAVPLGVREAVAVVDAFSARLRTHRDALNALNVFPVADNDTGTNMVHTLESIASALDDVETLDAAASAVESAALDGRGNSGLIIGQFLAGFFSSFGDDGIELACGLEQGARWARQAVANPVEGTILTVADAAALALASSPELSVDQLAGVVAAAVEATQEQLDVLAERGVVDSGAAGLQLFFEALRDVASGATSGASAAATAPELITCDVGLAPARDHGAYEIQFRVPATLVDRSELRALLVGLGTDVVIAASTDELSAHLHVEDPHPAAAAISRELENRPGAKAISYNVEPIVESGHLA